MKLIVITGTCGSGKSTVKDVLKTRTDLDGYECLDTDELGVNWWNYAGTDHESRFTDDCLKEAVGRAKGKDLIFSSCLNPADYLSKHIVPEEIEATCFIVLCPSDDKIRARLQARPMERGFTSDDIIRPHLEYNQWFRKNKGKFQLFIDNTDMPVEETVNRIVSFINGLK